MLIYLACIHQHPFHTTCMLVNQAINMHNGFFSLQPKKQHTPKTQHSAGKSTAMSTLSSITEILEPENHPKEPALLSRLNPLAIEWPLDKNNQSKRNSYLLQINSMLNPCAVSEPENCWFFLPSFLLSLLPFFFFFLFLFWFFSLGLPSLSPFDFHAPPPPLPSLLAFPFFFLFVFSSSSYLRFLFISCLFELLGDESTPPPPPTTCLSLLATS